MGRQALRAGRKAERKADRMEFHRTVNFVGLKTGFKPPFLFKDPDLGVFWVTEKVFR